MLKSATTWSPDLVYTETSNQGLSDDVWHIRLTLLMASQSKCNLLRFSVVFFGSAYANDHLRPKKSHDTLMFLFELSLLMLQGILITSQYAKKWGWSPLITSFFGLPLSLRDVKSLISFRYVWILLEDLNVFLLGFFSSKLPIKIMKLFQMIYFLKKFFDFEVTILPGRVYKNWRLHMKSI